MSQFKPGSIPRRSRPKTRSIKVFFIGVFFLRTEKVMKEPSSECPLGEISLKG